MSLPLPPKPPASRVLYVGMLSSFSGPEDKFEEWKATRRQRLIYKLEPIAQAAIPVLIWVALLGGILFRLLQP